MPFWSGDVCWNSFHRSRARSRHVTDKRMLLTLLCVSCEKVDNGQTRSNTIAAQELACHQGHTAVCSLYSWIVAVYGLNKFRVIISPSRWPHGVTLVCGHSLAGMVASNPARGMSLVSAVCCHVHCDGPIPRPGESDRVCVCVLQCQNWTIILCTNNE